MENAVDALKMAAAVLVFVMALSITMFMFTNARQTADAVLHSSDITEYLEYEQVNQSSENRIVGLETIIPTLYKYYKENYTVIFRDSSGNFLPLYKTKTNTDLWSKGYVNKYYGGKNKQVCSFDVDEETRRHEPWTGNNDFYKQNLDAFLKGGEFKAPSGNTEFDYNYKTELGNGGFIAKYKNKKFIENLGEYTYNEKTATSVKEKKKRVIIYTLQN